MADKPLDVYGVMGGSGKVDIKETPCLWDSIPERDRNKPMCISCPCPKCSPYSF